MAAQFNVEPRNIRRDKIGWLSATLLSMVFAGGCGPAADDGSGRRASARSALVTSVPPQDGQAFRIGVFVAAVGGEKAVQDALRQAGEANHLEVDIQPLGADAAAQAALLDRQPSRRTDALLVCALKPADLQTFLRQSADRQIPVMVVEYAEAGNLLIPANSAAAVSTPVGAGAKQTVPATIQNATASAQDVAGKRGALLTLLHNGKSTRQLLETTPPEIGATAVTALSAYLRGEKISR